MDDALCEMFPRPSHKQMLCSFPKCFLEADGDARAFLLLDVTENFCQSSLNYNVSLATYSNYKGHNTCKTLAGTDPIGCPWGGSVPDSCPGKASDVVMTVDSKILCQVHYGHFTKVDKGFPVENEALAEGIYVDRPQKRLKKQAAPPWTPRRLRRLGTPASMWRM